MIVARLLVTIDGSTHEEEANILDSLMTSVEEGDHNTDRARAAVVLETIYPAQVRDLIERKVS